MSTDLDPLFAAEAPVPLSFGLSHASDDLGLSGLSGAGAMAPQTELVAMLAHELRNPLQAISMASQLLETATASHPAVAQAHQVFDRQIAHMTRLLNDMLDASHASRGKIVLQLASVSLQAVVEAAIETSRPNLLGRRQTLAVDLPEQDVAITGDLTRLTQAFSNLLVNASQHTDIAGKITIDAVCRDTVVNVTVSDNGAGIPAELQPYIFDLFTQGQPPLDRAPGGLGIGLALVRTIVRMHGGDATVFSPGAGAGSSFTVSLPLGEAVPVAPTSPAPGAAASCKVLIIEDNVDANEIMAMLLEMNGHQVTSSFDGIDGLRLALAQPFDVVLCDLGLPGLTGLEVVAGLKAAYGQQPPLAIATTGYSDSAQRDLARAAGFDQYMVKPLDMPALLQAIARHIR